MDRLQISVMAASLALAMSLVATPAAAQDCQALVVDEAGALGAGIGQVQQAARELENRGAYVRVRTTTNFGGFPDVDRYEAALEARCSTWQDAAGGTKGNLIVLAVSFGEGRGAGLYYGDLWKRELDREWNPLLVDKVVPLLRSGDASGALVNALGGIGGIIDVQKATRGATGAVVVQQPTDLTGLWNVMGWVLAIAVLIALVLAVRAWRQSVARTREAQQKAQLAKAACTEHVTSTDTPLALADSRIKAAAKDFSPEDLAPLQSRLELARAELLTATRHYGELETGNANPDKPGLTVGQYDHFAAQYDRLADTLRTVRSRIDGIDSELAKLHQMAAGAQASIDEASAAIESADARITVVEHEGFRVPLARSILKDAVVELGTADDAKGHKAYTQTRAHVVAAKTKADRAADTAEAVRDGKRQIDDRLHAQEEEAAETERCITRAAEAFTAITQEYAPESWQHVTGNGSQAEAQLDDGREALAQAMASSGMDRQEWAQAQGELKRAGTHIALATELACAIVNLKQDLDRAKAAAPGEIEAAQKDIRAARQFIVDHDADVKDAHERDLDEAQRRLDEVRALLAGSQPNYIRVVKAALTVNTTADQILATAKAEHEDAQRQRRLADTTLREAERSYRAADDYIRSHSSDVDSDAGRERDEARTWLGRARTATSLQEQIDDAQRADQKADRALEMARADVRREQDARDRAARAAADALAAAARAAAHRRHTASSSTRSGHGGGSIGFGSGGRRSGGSAGSGGRGGRGGGSTGW